MFGESFSKPSKRARTRGIDRGQKSGFRVWLASPAPSFPPPIAGGAFLSPLFRRAQAKQAPRVYSPRGPLIRLCKCAAILLARVCTARFYFLKRLIPQSRRKMNGRELGGVLEPVRIATETRSSVQRGWRSMLSESPSKVGNHGVTLFICAPIGGDRGLIESTALVETLFEMGSEA